MFDFSGANDHQKKAISTVEGPLLITAGPGTGKTFTLVQRVIFLILEKQVKPESIMVATFTEKAARELVSRVSSELIRRNIKNINDMYIGTFHSICLRLLKENLEYTRLKKNFRTMDDFDQQYKLFGEINKLKNIEGYDQVVVDKGHWRASNFISGLMNILAEEQVDVETMLRCKDERIVTLGKIKQKYDQLLEEENLLDFSSIQTEAFNLLRGNNEVLENIREKIKYIMVDEYQDTNYIQEQLTFLIGLPSKNICVVGDDDQGLYRFRGATIRNILEFPEKFPDGECARVNLQINYRSNPDIVSFFNEWMSDDKAKEEGFNWDRFRYRKSIIPYKKKEPVSPAVIRIGASGDEWMEEVLKFCQMLVENKRITDYNQLAFLFSSVRAEKAQNLANHLESHGIKVYSPRSAMFFQREEIKLIIGCMLKMFLFYKAEIDNGEVKYLGPQDIQYYESCIEYTESLIKGKTYKSIRGYLDTRASAHTNMQKNADYSLAGLVYELISFSPFKEYIGTDLMT